MVIVTIGVILLSFLVWTVAYAWAKDKYERDLLVRPKEPLALPAPPPPPGAEPTHGVSPSGGP
jgi:hypothetical protein